MAQILVRQLDDRLVNALKQHARDEGLPLEAYLRNALQNIAARPTQADRSEAMQRLQKLWDSQPKASADSVPEIRTLRENP